MGPGTGFAEFKTYCEALFARSFFDSDTWNQQWQNIPDYVDDDDDCDYDNNDNDDDGDDDNDVDEDGHDNDDDGDDDNEDVDDGHDNDDDGDDDNDDVDDLWHRGLLVLEQQRSPIQWIQLLPNNLILSSFSCSFLLQKSLKSCFLYKGWLLVCTPSKSKHLKGQLGPRVCHVTFLDQRRSDGASV